MFRKLMEFLSDIGYANAPIERRAKLYLIALSFISAYTPSEYHEELFAQIKESIYDQLKEWDNGIQAK